MSIPHKGEKVNLPTKLLADFYTNDTLTIARQLLGQHLVRLYQGQRLSGRITEVEAYIGEEDQACHASCGLTARNAPMYGRPGYTYVYLIYGMYHCLNIVTEPDGYPAAVLIRALEPLEGIAQMQALRGPQHPRRNLTRGPGRLCQALAIDRTLNHIDLCAEEGLLWLEATPPVPDNRVGRSPRIGVRGDTAALTVPWRFYIRDSPWISGKS
ncbi:MAG: DNA-3-methyladenine glycosylase [Anaerolineae bacterium]|nr:DNA-3-methyladenine glycosylase [Anaerolineae bacterium]